MDNVFQQKSKIRSQIESKRRNLSGESVASQSSKIISHLKKTPEFQAAKAIAEAIRRFSTSSNAISEIIFVDKNKEFVQAMENDWNYTTPEIEDE